MTTIDWGHPGFLLVNAAEAFGVDPTGTADAGAQINTALTEIAAAGAAGQTLALTRGTYQLTTAVTPAPGQQIWLAAGVVFTGANAGSLTTYAGLCGPGANVAQPNPIKIACIGDSNTNGAQFGGYRQQFWSKLRQRRGDLRMLGNPAAASISDQGRYLLGEWATWATGGWTIENATAGFAALVASYGAPDVLLVMLGTNDTGDTLGQMQAAFAAFATQVQTSAPLARVIVSTVPVRQDSAGAYITLLTAFNAWLLSTGVAAVGSPLWSVVDGCSAFTLADFNADKLHLNEYGAAKLGDTFAAAFTALYPAPNGLAYPRAVMPRTAAQVARLTTPSVDFIEVNGAGQLPVTGESFAYSFWLNLDSAQSGENLLCTAGSGSGFTISLNISSGKMGLATAIESPSTGMNANFNQFFAPGQWMKIVYSYHNNDGIIALWCNGMLLNAVAQAAPTFAMSGTQLLIGNAGARGTNGFTGDVSDFQGSYGSAVPSFANMREVVERGYFEDAGLPNPTFDFRLNNDAGVDACGGAAIPGFSSFTYVSGPTMPVDPPTIGPAPLQVAGVTAANATAALTLPQLLNQNVESSGNSSGTVTLTAVTYIPGMQWTFRNNNTSTSTTTFMGITVAVGKSAIIRINSAGAGERVTADT